MPGISLCLRKSGTTPISRDHCSRIREAMLHFPFYRSSSVIEEDRVNIGYTGYDEYPMEVIDNKDFTVVLEGRIYSAQKNAILQTLFAVAAAQVGSDKVVDDVVKQFLLAAEGEFVIIIYDKVKKRITLANDLLGRLPLYFSEDTESLFVSRELKFILPFLPKVEFNKDGILEYLLYGFPFAENTFVTSVRFFPPATWMSVDLDSGSTVRECYHVLNIDNCSVSGDHKKLAADMSRIFMDGMARRVAWVDKNNTIVSLSGGFDSRATLAGMKNLGLCPIAVTAQSEEEAAAREVAGFMKTEVYAIPQCSRQNDTSFAEVVFLKDGLDCHPNLVQLYKNLSDLRDRFGGDVVYFTGIFGGEITRHSHITGGLSSLDSLVRYLMNANDSYKYSTEKVSAILQVSQAEIKKHLKHYLESLPEKNIFRKYARFRHEYDNRFAGEAEDRNRYYFWTISPFFAFPFFSYCMRMDEKKKTSWLFRDFLFSLDPDTCKAKYFNYGLPLNYSLVLWCLAIIEGLARHAVVKNSLKLVKRVLKVCRNKCIPLAPGASESLTTAREAFLWLLETSEPVKTFFMNPALRAFILKEDDIKGLDRLRIIATYMDTATRWHARLIETERASATGRP